MSGSGFPSLTVDPLNCLFFLYWLRAIYGVLGHETVSPYNYIMINPKKFFFVQQFFFFWHKQRVKPSCALVLLLVKLYFDWSRLVTVEGALRV